MFDPAQYQQTIDKISGKLQDIPKRASELEVRAQQLASEWYIPEPLAEFILYLSDQFVKLAKEVIDLVVEIMEGVEAPFWLYQHSYTWETIRGLATGVAADINPAELGSTADWKGTAATAYTQAITPQSAAAARLGALADKMSTNLSTCAAGGFAFYVAVLALLVAFASAQIAAAAATATGAGAPVGILGSLTSGSFTFGTMVTFVGAFATFTGIQAGNLNALHGEAVDGTAFPHGRWPQAVNI
jgi:hypothetical protein